MRRRVIGTQGRTRGDDEVTWVCVGGGGDVQFDCLR